VLELMLAALRVREEKINAIAIELMGRLDEHPVPQLIIEACNRKNSLGHRLRILRKGDRWALAPFVSGLDAALRAAVLPPPAPPSKPPSQTTFLENSQCFAFASSLLQGPFCCSRGQLGVTI
jgi:hypothetical protein